MTIFLTRYSPIISNYKIVKLLLIIQETLVKVRWALEKLYQVDNFSLLLMRSIFRGQWNYLSVKVLILSQLQQIFIMVTIKNLVLFPKDHFLTICRIINLFGDRI